VKWAVSVNARRLIPLLLAAALLLAGCNGGTVDRHALTKDSGTLDSIACEGALLADDAARGRTTSVFAREQAEALQVQAEGFSDALAKRKTLPSIERKVRAAARRAAVIAAVLERLHDHASDQAVAAESARRLHAIGRCP